ncbi:MOSC domain-containing protein [Amycolatopsis sp. 195334CR]|uniref:MOSC domain-containing protein n=1 Tax=Amycolatopsis sp. 195334CR TaxID=2814588 RepID=UPI001A8E2099|nr:MOSC domain-containing protein [Amycolatopsis sp. 195334CR]MBN6037671.1 molybdenum cofactor biosysynthesis protein [Amycolatopsis sp. 195334CR]
MRVEIVALLVSSRHAFEGRPKDGPRPDPEPPARERVTVRAGLGLVGDRFFNHAAHRHAAVTVFAAESLDHLVDALSLPAAPDPHLTRRNITLRGFDVDGLERGTVFSLDSGDGPVRFRAHRPAHPCAWMDVVLAPGAFRGLRRRGGIRCEPLDDGVLRLGPAALEF